ncbi:MAG: XRE family transcriptional regulator [Muribaculaceae bacterium]|nr:XRE family transcriptional regulator [Muribaculaceae bacterium]
MNIHIGLQIRHELRRRERTVAWFARKICCTRTHAYKIFEKDNIDIKLLARICQVLDHDFFADISADICRKKGDTSVAE